MSSKLQCKMAPRFRWWKQGAGRAGAWLIGAGGLAAGLVALSMEAGHAQGGRGRSDPAGKPILAVVSLSDQRVSIYTSEGKILEAPVSTGQTGYETPAGIFTIVQKEEDHYSNLYEDGEMPFMERITWTGIALHAGNLPGHPASHGCVRMPMAFAQQLYGMTDLGMRVLIVREDMRPSDIARPAMFRPKPVPRELVVAAQRSTKLAALTSGGDFVPGSAAHIQLLQWAAAERIAELEAAVRQQRTTRTTAARSASEAVAAGRVVRSLEADLSRAESALKDADGRLEKVTAPDTGQQEDAARAKAQAKFEELQGTLQAAKAKAAARVEELQAKLKAARVQEEARREAAQRAEEEAKGAAEAKDRATQAAQEAKLRTFPVSVFVSRKMQRLYVRKGNMPVFEAPVTIRDPQAPIGTFVFTSIDPGTAGEMRWNVVAMYRNPTNIEPASNVQPRRGARNPPTPTDVGAAAAALNRIAPTQEALDVISEVVLPGSSLIISDEGPSHETGKDTDFVVVMSDDPQGALKIRQREPGLMDGFDNWPPWARGSSGKSPFGDSFPMWKW
ncbi:MAG: L,D-transpeptidase family protein [Hyphomicrobiaceae bacterium]|nr:L,D-transpeptidase family protein [Hyphomicrobiaceae bacterium]